MMFAMNCMKQNKIIIKDGVVKFIYDDKMNGLLNMGNSTVSRASHVEPQNVNGSIRWFADLSPSGGGILGPFIDRQDALDAEVQWLIDNDLGV